MEPKLKHKTAIIDPEQIFVMEINRSQRRNKTMLKTHKNSKDPNSSQNFTNQKQIKTIVEGKIQELHRQMKQFFNQERKSHLQQIAPDMQALKKLICQLRQQLNRPKSMQEIEKEKHELFRRKIRILQQIQKINKQLKGNKKEFFQMKLQGDQVERQVNNALATLKKYKHKMNKKIMNKEKQQQNSLNNLQVTDDKKDTSKINRILNDSLIEQNEATTKHQNLRVSFQHNINKKQNSSSSNENDHIHITQVIEKQESKYKLPFIKVKSGLLDGDAKISKINNKFTQLESCRNSHLKKKPLNSNTIGSNTVGNKSTTSFASKLNPFDTISHSNLSYTNLNSQFFHSKPKKSMPFDLSLEFQRYEQLVNKEKWTQVQKLFEQIDDIDAQYKQGTKNGLKSTVKSSSPVNILSQLLMDELRKLQFASYKQKGYHQGLKDKTYQIKIQLKNIFKNFSPDEFFSKAMNKKAVQKQLLKVLQNSVEG